MLRRSSAAFVRSAEAVSSGTEKSSPKEPERKQRDEIEVRSRVRGASSAFPEPLCRISVHREAIGSA
jgi:hypothetical protein